MLQELHLPVFAEQLHTKFRVNVTVQQAVDMELVQARDLGSTDRQETFSVVLRGLVYLPQQIYSVEHPVLGTFDLFLVPVGQEPGGILFEAVFNRLVDRA